MIYEENSEPTILSMKYNINFEELVILSKENKINYQNYA